MIALGPICDRLRAGGCARVEGVLELAAIDAAAPRQLPAFFVVPTSETGGGNALDQGRDQPVDVGFSVVVLVDGARRDRAGVSEQLRDEANRARDAVLGWTHPEASRACSFAGGRLVSVTGPTVAWEVRLTTRVHLRRKT